MRGLSFQSMLQTVKFRLTLYYILYIQVYIYQIQFNTFQLGNYEVACFPRNSSYVDTKTKEAPAHVYIIPSIDSKPKCSFKQFLKIRFIGFADIDAVEVKHRSKFLEVNPVQVLFLALIIVYYQNSYF